MACYLVVNASITDPEGLQRYQAVVGPTFKGHEVRVLVATNEATTVEGTPAGPRVVVLEFADRDAALAWYHSDAYQQVIGLRLGATEGFAVLADGLG